MPVSSFSCAVCSALLVALQLGSASTPDNNEDIEFSNGVQLFGGDIVLSREQDDALSLVQPSTESGARYSRAVITVTSKKWPDGIIPYRISNLLNTSAKEAIEAAMQQIRRDTEFCVDFRVVQSTDHDFVHFFRGKGCYSNIGRQGGQQNISIGDSCDTNGLVMHEIIHALGRWHEQSRPDRDSFVTINADNIRDGFQGNFKIVEDGGTSTQGMPYDFDSIMHYDAYAFSSNSQPTITPLDHAVRLQRLGQRRLLSTTDIEHIKALYCPNGKSEWTRWSSWSQCSSSCGTGTRSRSRTCIERNGPCLGSTTEEEPCNKEECPTATVSELKEWGTWSSWSGCSQSCGNGQRSRIRDCLLASPLACQGSRIEVGECNIQPCSEQSEWTPWSSWSSCTPSPKTGIKARHRTRRCRTVDSKVQLKDVFCPGVAMETEPCSNFSCSDFGGLARCEGCSINTCLSGLRLVGCRQLTPDQLKTVEMVYASDESETLADKILKSCGKVAVRRGYDVFGLNGSSCILGTEVSSPRLQFCKEEEIHVTGQAIEFYEISDQEAFELSIRAYDSCGSTFCHTRNETVISSASKIQFHLFSVLSSFLILVISSSF